MFSATIGTNWAIPNVGTFRPCFDRVVIVSSTPVGVLKTRLPLRILEEVSEIAPEPTGHGLPLSKCEAYNRVYEQSYGSS